MLRAWSSVKDPVDNENLVASYHPDDMIIRMFRAKSNLNDRYRTDFFVPGRGFQLLTWLANGSLVLILVSVIAVYFLIQIFGALNSYVDHPLGYWPTITILATCALLHLIGIAFVGVAYKEFAFNIVFEPFKPSTSKIPE